MYRKEPEKQLNFEDFYLPFGGHLNGNNRRVRLADAIPWNEFEGEYAAGFSPEGMGAPAKIFRTALGAELIKRKLDITDEEVVEQIRENHYLQYFIGMEGYRDEAPFDASMMTHFRERLTPDMLNRVNERVIETDIKKKEPEKAAAGEEAAAPVNKGKLLLDATCVPQDIRFPTDLSLLNEAREKTEEIIDLLYEAGGKRGKKPRTYRKRARGEYLAAAKRRKKSAKTVRRAVRKQLGYVGRNLKTIEKLKENGGLGALGRKKLRNLQVCHEVYRQQKEMYRERKHRVEDRIVSIGQPHVRPVVRGKAGSEVEFGSKLMISVVDGYTRIEELAWENYNEGTLLKAAVDAYKERYGYYPASVHADTIFRTKENRKYCAENGIRMSGPPLGRPCKDAERNREARKQRARDERDRIPVEGKFGNVKRRYGLDRIFAKKKNTSECEVAIAILLLNLCRPRRGHIFAIFCVMRLYAKNTDMKSCNTPVFHGKAA
jgi:hypothetical protein